MDDMTATTLYFAQPGPHNTDKTLQAAHARALALGINQVVLASNEGGTAIKALDLFKTQRVVVVTHAAGFRQPGDQEMSPAMRDRLQAIPHVAVLTATHAFGGIGRAVRNKLNAYQVDEIIAYTLRTFSQGVKVGCELVLMAADAGLLDMAQEVVAIGGSGRGCDTALVIKPAHTQNYFDLRVLELICKPRMG